MLDQVIATIRGSDDRGAARIALMAAPFSFSEEQANHILDMTLGRLTRLGRRELDEEMAKLRETIAELQSILADDAKLRGVIADEMTVIRDKYANDRVTQIVNDPGELGMEDLIKDEDIVITMTHAGYVKSVAADAFRVQGRGGRGVQGAKLRDEDFVEQIVHSTTHSYLLLFSNRGRVFRLRGHEIPMKETNGQGNCDRESAQSAAERIDPGDRHDERLSEGQVPRVRHRKRHRQEDGLQRVRQVTTRGWIAINLRDGDEVVRVVATSGSEDLMVLTYRGMSIRFNEAEVREVGRDSMGVRGIKLKDDDKAIALDVVRDDADLFLVTDTGFGKRVKIERFNRQGRGGQGVRAIKLTAARGFVVAAFMVRLDDEVMLASSGGVLIRTPVREVSSQGRDATGVRVMNLDEGHSVATAALVELDDEV